MGAITVSVSSIPAASLANGSQSVTLGPIGVTINSPVLAIIPVVFASGTFINTASPSGSTVCVIVGPSGATQSLTIKGISGDTGIVCSANGLVGLVQFSNPNISNNVGLTSSAAIAGDVYLCFY